MLPRNAGMMAMRWLDSAIRRLRAPRGERSRLAATVLLAALLPAAAEAQVTPECRAELAALDRSFVATMARLLAAGPPAEMCAALKDQIDAVAKAVEVQMRCRVPGSEVDRVVAMLSASGTDFRQLQTQLGCNVPA